MEVGGDVLDLFSQFGTFEPLGRDGADSEQCIQDVAGDRVGAITVAAMIDGEENGTAELVVVGRVGIRAAPAGPR